MFIRQEVTDRMNEQKEQRNVKKQLHCSQCRKWNNWQTGWHVNCNVIWRLITTFRLLPFLNHSEITGLGESHLRRAALWLIKISVHSKRHHYTVNRKNTHQHDITWKNGSRPPRPLYRKNSTKIHYMMYITGLQYYGSRCHGDLPCNHTVHPD